MGSPQVIRRRRDGICLAIPNNSKGVLTINKATTALTACLVMAGCASNSTYYLSGGNRAAGTVTLTCSYPAAALRWEMNCDDVTPENEQAAKLACQRWGYQDAKPFGSVRFSVWGEEIEYQCIGDLEQ